MFVLFRVQTKEPESSTKVSHQDVINIMLCASLLNMIHDEFLGP